VLSSACAMLYYMIDAGLFFFSLSSFLTENTVDAQLFLRSLLLRLQITWHRAMTNIKSVLNSDEVTQNKDLAKEKLESVTARMDLTHAKRFMQQDSGTQFHI